ncbi:MAG: amidohydrolase family protein [Candidatus Thorarchaeota archaeon]
MLVVRAVEDQPEKGIKKGQKFKLYIVDAHHHMGREKGHTNTPPGAYEFYASLWLEMQRMVKDLKESDSLLFEPVDVVPSTLPSKCFSSRKSWARLNHGWLVDRTIVFPFTDDYLGEGKGASFKASNDKIAGWTTRAPHSTRLIGFARVDPKDALKSKNAAVRELNRAVTKLGLRGLKLHPIAQLFVEEIEDDMTLRVVRKAGELKVPIIFDTRNIRTAQRIHSMVETMREEPKYARAMKGLRVILAHCGMSPGDPHFHELLRNPAIYGETSTLHDQDVPVLFRTATEMLENASFHWSEKLLFGTDFSFLSVQAVDVILHLLSRDFIGSLSDMQRILGGNALSLVGTPFRTKLMAHENPRMMTCTQKKKSARSALESSLVAKIAKGELDLASLDYMLPPQKTWPDLRPTSAGGNNGIYFDSYFMTLRTRYDERECMIWVKSHPNDMISCVILNDYEKATMLTTELAQQKKHPILSADLTSNSQLFSTPDEFTSAIESLLE